MHVRTVFITGTDTGVGKTLLTALLLSHLRREQVPVFALKPFCSGGRRDAELLHQLQDGELTIDQINPFYFPEPVAPLVSARKHHRKIVLEEVVEHIHSIKSKVGTRAPGSMRAKGPVSRHIVASRSQPGALVHDGYLLVEGSGGLLVPLGEGYTVLDLIRVLDCDVLVVSRNQLGTINHSLLTVQSLCSGFANPAARGVAKVSSTAEASRPRMPKLVLMGSGVRDASQRSNPAILAEMVKPVRLVRLPFLGENCLSQSALEKNAKIFEKTLARLLL